MREGGGETGTGAPMPRRPGGTASPARAGGACPEATAQCWSGLLLALPGPGGRDRRRLGVLSVIWGHAAGRLTCAGWSGRIGRAGELVVADQPPLVIQAKVPVVVDLWSASNLGSGTGELRAASCGCHIRERCDSLAGAKRPLWSVAHVGRPE